MSGDRNGISQTGPKEAAYLTNLLVIARVEATLFLGLGAGAICTSVTRKGNGTSGCCSLDACDLGHSCLLGTVTVLVIWAIRV